MNIKKRTIDLGVPSRLLIDHGVGTLPITLLKRTLKLKTRKHGLAIDAIKDLPKKIENPLFIMKSKVDNITRLLIVNAYVLDEGLMTITVSEEKYGRDQKINRISSIHGRNAKQIWYDIKEGRCQYVDKTKVLKILTKGTIPNGENSQDFAAKIKHYFETSKRKEENIIGYAYGNKKGGYRLVLRRQKVGRLLAKTRGFLKLNIMDTTQNDNKLAVCAGELPDKSTTLKLCIDTEKWPRKAKGENIRLEVVPLDAEHKKNKQIEADFAISHRGGNGQPVICGTVYKMSRTPLKDNDLER